MTDYVTNLEGGNKTAELSNPGKLLRAYMQATGTHCAKALADSLGIKLRTIQRLKLEIATCANDAKCAISGAANSANDAINGVSQQSDGKKVSPTPPSKNNSNLETTVIHPSPREDGRINDVDECKAAFNGSTEAMLTMVESAMGGHCRKNAAQWLANLTRINGQQAVAEAFQKFLTCKAEGQIIARPLPWFDTTAKNCKRDAAKNPPALENPFAEQTKGVKRHVQPAPDDPSYLANFGRRRPVEAARA